jgi:hypothetical protein
MKVPETLGTRIEIRRLLDRSGPIRAAVSCWGDGAVDGLGITAWSDLTIACDILSGGCNPAEGRKLRGIIGPERVLTHDRLHAKVWRADTADNARAGPV